jgi:hypothetical protein
MTNIDIGNMTFSLLQAPVANSNGIIFLKVDSSTVKYCTFYNCAFGISDAGSAGGNEYTSLTFKNVDQALTISQSGTTTIVLNQCGFAAPAK